MLDAINWSSSALLAACALPAAWAALKERRCDQSWLFLGLWLAGELLRIVYALAVQNLALGLGCAVNAFCILVLALFNERPVRAGKDAQ